MSHLLNWTINNINRKQPRRIVCVGVLFMIRILLILFVLCLALLGLTDVIYFATKKMLTDKDYNGGTILVFLEEKTATRMLRFQIFRKKWYGRLLKEKIIALTDNLSPETTDRCFETVKGTGIILAEKKYINHVLNSLY